MGPGDPHQDRLLRDLGRGISQKLLEVSQGLFVILLPQRDVCEDVARQVPDVAVAAVLHDPFQVLARCPGVFLLASDEAQVITGEESETSAGKVV